VSTVRRGLRRLEAAGLVKTKQVGLRRTNRYRVLNPGSVTTDEGCSAKPVNMPDRSRVTVPRGRRTSKPALPPKPLHYVQSLSRQRRAASQNLHHGESIFGFTEEQLAASDEYEYEELRLLDSSLAAYVLELELEHSTPYDTGLVGIEPPRPAAEQRLVTETKGAQPMPEVDTPRGGLAEGVVSHLRATVQGGHFLVFEDGQEFPLLTARGTPCTKRAAAVLKLYGKRVSFPVDAVSGAPAGRPKVLDASTVEDKAPVEVATGYPVTEELATRQSPVEDESRSESVPTRLDEPMPWDSEQKHDAWNRYVEEQARSEATEPQDEPEQPATKRDLEGLEERLIEEIPLAVAIAVGGHPAEEGALYTAADAEEERIE
jgi:hypothetical protein